MTVTEEPVSDVESPPAAGEEAKRCAALRCRARRIHPPDVAGEARAPAG